MDEEMIDVGGTQIAYRRTGAGPDVVFVHGWPLHRETWRHVVDELPEFTCHIFDLPFAGKSSATSTGESNLASLTKAIVDLIEHLGLQRLALVGHDSGGMLARYAAAELGHRVEALVISGSEIPGHHPPFLARLVRAARLPGASAVLRTALRSERLTASSFLFGETVADRQLLQGEFRTLFIDPLVHERTSRDAALAVLGSFSPDYVDGLASVHARLAMPTLAIWGRGDGFFPAKKARVMMRQFGGPTKFVSVDDARLLVHEEHPKRFAEACKDFFAEWTQPPIPSGENPPAQQSNA